MSEFLPDTYSRRNGLKSPSAEDVYEYNKLEIKIKNQIWMIISRGIGPYHLNNKATSASPVYKMTVEFMRDEVGKLTLSENSSDFQEELFLWFQVEENIFHIIDFIEFLCAKIDGHVREKLIHFHGVPHPDKTIGEINARMLEEKFGFQYDNGKIIKISSQMMHAEIIIPVLELINNKKYETVNKEYRKSFDHFRYNNYESSIIEACKAVESTLKIIGKNRKWDISDDDPISKLITAAYSANFIPSWMQSGLTSLRALLSGSSGVVRNKMAAHGAGAQPRDVGHEVCAFQIHQAGAVILFLIEHDKVTP